MFLGFIRRYVHKCFVVGFLLSVVFVSQTILAAAPASYAPAIKKASPAVVNIFTTKKMAKSSTDNPTFKYFFNQPQKKRSRMSLGSGVIVSKSGYVLTNNHVVEGAKDIVVAFADGRRIKAKVIGTDPESDLAVIKIEAKDLHPISMVNSDTVEVGEVVLAIGNPFGLTQTVTQGIVSAVGRDNLGINRFENFIQTDAAINPGNSGGALVNSNGNLVGINSAIFSRSGGNQGVGFAIPANLAKRVMYQLIKNGEVVRGWLGVAIKPLDKKLSKSFFGSNKGVMIMAVTPRSPAFLGGLRQGDVVLSVDNNVVRDVNDFLRDISRHNPADKVMIKILRNGKKRTLHVVLGKRPKKLSYNNESPSHARPQHYYR